jgi:uncharacterized protein (TIGR00369 family)
MNDTFAIRNQQYARLTRESFARQTFMVTLGAQLVRVAPGEVDIVLPYSPALCQQNSFLHAGALTSIADSANGYAAFTLFPPATDVLAVEFKISLLAPAKAPRFLATGCVLRPGRTLTVCQCHVFGLGERAAPLWPPCSPPLSRGRRSGQSQGPPPKPDDRPSCRQLGLFRI